MAKNAPTPKIVTKKHLARLERENLQRRYLLIGSIIVGILVVGIVTYGILDQSVLLYLRPVAKVGNQSITLGDFQKRVRFTRYQLIQQYNQYYQLVQMFGGPSSFGGQFATQLQSMQSQLDPANANQFGTTTLDGMIDDINIANEAKKRGITVSADEINKSMESAFNYFPNGTPSPTVTPTTGATSTLSALQMTLVPPTPTETTTPTPAATETPIPATSTPTPEPTKPGATPTITQTPTITPTATPYTFQGYQTQVSDYANQLKSTGFTEADIRAMVKAQLLRQKVEDAITVNVKPQQEQVWARDIELPDETSAIAARARLTKGEDFATVAKAVSTDTATKDLGGDMGWFPAGQKDPAIDTAAFSLKIGEISQPIKGASGYYIIQVLGHELRPLTDSEFQALRQEDFQKWLDTARTAKDVQIFDFYLQHVPTEPTLSPNEQIPQ